MLFLKTFLFPNKNIVDKILTSNRLLNEAKNTRNSNLYLNVKQISEAQKLPDAGVFMSFGDFYSVTTQNSFLESKYDSSREESISNFKLSIKLPFLISDRSDQYQLWREWYPEANVYVLSNKDVPFRTRFLQWMAAKNIWFVVRLYYWLVYRIAYRLLFR